MNYREALSQNVVAISISESPDMPILGLSDEHLRDAMVEIARHLLALGARLMYGGDLRPHGFTELLFELVARHRRDADEGDDRRSVINYLGWPVHISIPTETLSSYASEVINGVELRILTMEGETIALDERLTIKKTDATDEDWSLGLTAMRRAMQKHSNARIVLGGKTEKYKGKMPGVAEEALISLQEKQPLFILGGFGGCARDIAQILGLCSSGAVTRSPWPGQKQFSSFDADTLNNGLTPAENTILAQTPHIDQAIALILHGLLTLNRRPNVSQLI